MNVQEINHTLGELTHNNFLSLSEINHLHRILLCRIAARARKQKPFGLYLTKPIIIYNDIFADDLRHELNDFTRAQ